MLAVFSLNQSIIHLPFVLQVVLYGRVFFAFYMSFFDVFSHYHTTHLSAGFMGEPAGQFQAVENSAIFIMGTSTRYFPGE